MLKTIELPTLLKLIDISAPYFAFDKIQVDETNTLHANVPTQQPLGLELGPITAAEASRHLAILGVCSCALANTTVQKHYYLAYRGVYEKTANASPDSKLRAEARCVSVDRRKAEAETRLIDESGNVIVVLRVYYHVILDTTFARFYKDNFIEKPDFKLSNPYAVKHPFVKEEFTETQMTASMGKIPEYYCSGHFPQYPALPVAILVYNLFDMACRLMAHNLGEHDAINIVKQYEITADNLAFAGDMVELEANYISSDENLHKIEVSGTANGTKSVGKIELILERSLVGEELYS
ncbi:MAG: hypothetical protein U0V72_10395 [Cytophagales bacterium]